jgi:peptide-methionine (R)-S-oxide reductase
MTWSLMLLAMGLLVLGCERRVVGEGSGPAMSGAGGGGGGEKVVKSEEEWRKVLSPEQYRVLRQKGTERAFTGEYDHTF